MRVLHFDRYDGSKRDAPIQARAWIIIWAAVGAFPAGNKEQTITGNKLWEALKGASEEVGEDARRLNPSGSDVYLEDAEFRILGQAIEKIRDQIRIANADALLWVDNLLDKAPELSKEAFKGGKRLKD